MPSAIISSAQPGTIAHYAGGTVPPNYLLCDGSTYATATYPQLFAVIGYTYGGSGPNFLVPDVRRRVLMGSGGSGTATIGNAVGNTGGEENHVLALGELAAHSHGISDPGHLHDVGRPATNLAASGSNIGSQLITTGGAVSNQTYAATTGISTVTAGSSTGHNTIQPSLVITQMIRF